MFNLYEILQNAQDGKAVENLARQFNVAPEQADAVLKALAPDFSAAFMNNAGQPAGFASMLGAMGDPQHAAAFADAAAANSREAMQKGSDFVATLFGGGEREAAATQNAAAFAGLPPALVQQMLPVIASMILGGLSKSMANQGFGGLLGQLAGAAAAQGGLGQILGSLFGQGAPTSAPAGQAGAGQAGAGQAANPMGGLAGMFGQIVGSFFGGAPGQAAPQPNASAPNPSAQNPWAAPGARPGGFDPATVQAGLEALIKMMQPGGQTQTASRAADLPQDDGLPQAPSGLKDDIDSIFRKRP